MPVKASSSSSVRSAAAALWLGSLMAVPAEARHAGSSKEPQLRRAARELRQKVEAALGRADFALAHKLLDDAYRQSPQPQTLYLLGRLAQAEGRALDAMDLLRRFVAEPGADSEDLQAVARKLVALPRPLCGEVVIHGERGAVLTVDDRPVGVLPLPTPLLLSPGPHLLAMSLGTRRQEELYKVMASRTAELRFQFSSDAVVATLQPAVLLLVQPTLKVIDQGSPESLSDEEIQALEQAVTRAATEKQLGVQGKTAALSTSPRLSGCLSELRCQLSLAEENQATLLLLLHVEVSHRWRSGRELKLKLEALDTSVTERAAQAARTCSGCGLSQAGDETALLTSQVLTDALTRPRGTIVVRSQPEGAEVVLDGRTLGLTPLRRTVWAGSHSLTLRKEGLLPASREISLSAGQLQTVEQTLLVGSSEPLRQITIVEGESERSPSGQRPRWRILAGASSVMAGAVMIGFGLSALAVNSRCVSGLGDVTTQCMQVYDTTVPGSTLTSIGGAALLTGTMLLVWPPAQDLATDSTLRR